MAHSRDGKIVEGKPTAGGTKPDEPVTIAGPSKPPTGNNSADAGLDSIVEAMRAQRPKQDGAGGR